MRCGGATPPNIWLFGKFAVADREVAPWVFSRKGKLGSSDVISEIATKLVKIWPCCKRNGHGLFWDLFLLVTRDIAIWGVGVLHSPDTWLVGKFAVDF